MNEELYICDYPYLVYTSIIRAIENPKINHDLLITDSIDGMSSLYLPIKKSGIFKNVFFYNDEIFKNHLSKLLPYFSKFSVEKNIIKKLKFVSKILQLVQVTLNKTKDINLPAEIKNSKYNKIYYSDRMGSLMFYLNKNNIKYTAMEHGKNVWSTKQKKDVFFIKTFSLLEKLGIAPGISAFSKSCNEILVNDQSIIKNTPKHVVITEWSMDDAINRLSDSDMERIFETYSMAYNIKLNNDIEYNLLLTTPLYIDRRADSEISQINFYKSQISKNMDTKYPLIIKSHPRDKVDYKKHFPDAIIIDQSVSSEILSFSKGLKFNTVLTCLSSSVEIFRKKTKKTIILIPNNQIENANSIINKCENQGVEYVG